MMPETFMFLKGAAVKEGIHGKPLAGPPPDSTADGEAISREMKSFEEEFRKTLFRSTDKEEAPANLIQNASKPAGELSEAEVPDAGEALEGGSSSWVPFSGSDLDVEGTPYQSGIAGIEAEDTTDTTVDYVNVATGPSVQTEPTKGPPGRPVSELLSIATERSETGLLAEGIYFKSTAAKYPDDSVVSEYDSSLEDETEEEEALLMAPPVQLKDDSGVSRLAYNDMAKGDSETDMPNDGEGAESFHQIKRGVERRPAEAHMSSTSFEGDEAVDPKAGGIKDTAASKNAGDQNITGLPYTEDEPLEANTTENARASGHEPGKFADEEIAQDSKRIIITNNKDFYEARTGKIQATDTATEKRDGLARGAAPETHFASGGSGDLALKNDNATEGTLPGGNAQDEGSPEEVLTKTSFTDRLVGESGVQSETELETPLEMHRTEKKESASYNDDEITIPYAKDSGGELSRDSQSISGRVKPLKAHEVVEVSAENTEPGVETTAEMEEEAETQAFEDASGETGEESGDSTEEAVHEDYKDLDELAMKAPRDTDIDALLKEALRGKEGKANAAFANISEEALVTGDGASKVSAKTHLPGSTQAAAGRQGAYISKSFETFFVKGVAARVSVAFNENIGKATIILNPPELGRLKVEMALKDNIMQASFRAENINVKEALERNMDLLKAALVEQGFSVDELSVALDKNYGRGGARFDGESPQRQSSAKGEGGREENLPGDSDTDKKFYDSGNNSGVDLFI